MKEYKDYLFHIKGSLKGALFGILACLLVELLVMVFLQIFNKEYYILEVTKTEKNMTDKY